MLLQFHSAVDFPFPDSTETSSTVIFGLIKYINVRNDMFNSRGYVDPAKLRPASRLGDISYGRIGEAYQVKWKFWGEDKEKMDEVMKKAAQAEKVVEREGDKAKTD